MGKKKPVIEMDAATRIKELEEKIAAMAAEKKGGEITHVLQPADARRPPPPLEWTEDQRDIIKRYHMKDATDEEFLANMAVARAKGLDPLKKEIVFRHQRERIPGMKGDGADCYRMVWIYIVTIDGLRSIAEKTGLYDGQDEPEFVYEEGKACASCGRAAKRFVAARVKIYRKDIARPFVGMVFLEEFSADNHIWKTMPRHMAAKVAEALAFRRAFPDGCGNLFAPEEFAVDPPPAENAVDRMSATTPAPPSSREAEPKLPPVNQLAEWAKKFEQAGSVKALQELGHQVAQLVLTAADRNELARQYNTWRQHYEKLEQPKLEREPGSDG